MCLPWRFRRLPSLRASSCFVLPSQEGVLVGAQLRLFPHLTSCWSSWCPACLLRLTFSCLWNTSLCGSSDPEAGGSTLCLQHRWTSGLMMGLMWGFLCSGASDLSFFPLYPLCMFCLNFLSFNSASLELSYCHLLTLTTRSCWQPCKSTQYRHDACLRAAT